jgi:pimeloyl-ACP methyl ester carboxylesterase
MELRANDFTFPVLTAGPQDGEGVLLLHGFPQTARAWRAQVDALAQQGYRAVAPELRGIAGSARPAELSGYTLAQGAADVHALADTLGWERFHLAGHDLGGIIAWEVGCRHPGRLLSLSVLSTPHLAPFATALADKSQTRLPPFGLFRAAGSAELLLAGDGAALRAAFDGIDGSGYVTAYQRPGVLAAMLNWFRAADFDDWLTLADCPVPTLFMWGTDDPYLAAETAYATRSHASGPYTELPLDGIGHWAPELAPDATTAALLTHLSRAAGPAAASRRP